MSDNYDYRPKLSVIITDEQAKDLQDLIPWGDKGALFSVIIDDLIELIKTHGDLTVATIISKKIKPRDCLASMNVERTPRRKKKES